jgi:AraC-like DNA-binding protein
MCDGNDRTTVIRSEASLHLGAARTNKPLVVSCGCSPVQQARLTEALRGVALLRSIPQLGAPSLATWLDVPDILVVAVEPNAARDIVALVRDARSRCPRTALIAYCSGIRDTPASIGSLAAAGIHQFLFAEINDRGCMLRAILDDARQQCVAELLTSALRTLLPPVLQPIVEAALTRPAVVTDVTALATALGIHRRTIFNRCARAGRLGPQELLTWVRLCLVGYLLESTGCTVESIALQLGYSSPTTLRNTIKRHIGLRATEIRTQGGFQLVVERLQRRLGASPSVVNATGVAESAATLHAV